MTGVSPKSFFLAEICVKIAGTHNTISSLNTKDVIHSVRFALETARKCVKWFSKCFECVHTHAHTINSVQTKNKASCITLGCTNLWNVAQCSFRFFCNYICCRSIELAYYIDSSFRFFRIFAFVFKRLIDVNEKNERKKKKMGIQWKYFGKFRFASPFFSERQHNSRVLKHFHLMPRVRQ